MSLAIDLRADYDGTPLRRLARASKSANQARRLLAPAAIYDRASRTAAARLGGVGLPIVRDWVERFNDRGPDGLLDGKAPGRQSLINDAQRQTLAAIVESGPIPAIHGVVTCRPHSSLGYQSPANYAETNFAMGSGMPAPIANKAPKGITTTAEALIRAG